MTAALILQTGVLVPLYIPVVIVVELRFVVVRHVLVHLRLGVDEPARVSTRPPSGGGQQGAMARTS